MEEPEPTVADVVLVDEGMGVNLALASVVEESGGTLEVFVADTGANRSI